MIWLFTQPFPAYCLPPWLLNLLPPPSTTMIRTTLSTINGPTTLPAGINFKEAGANVNLPSPLSAQMHNPFWAPTRFPASLPGRPWSISESPYDDPDRGIIWMPCGVASDRLPCPPWRTMERKTRRDLWMRSAYERNPDRIVTGIRWIPCGASVEDADGMTCKEAGANDRRPIGINWVLCGESVAFETRVWLGKTKNVTQMWSFPVFCFCSCFLCASCKRASFRLSTCAKWF